MCLLSNDAVRQAVRTVLVDATVIGLISVAERCGRGPSADGYAT